MTATWVAKSPPSGTSRATGTAIIDLGFTTKPCEPAGVAAPAAAEMKETSATAGVELGFTREMTGDCPLDVEFPAKFQIGAVEEAHGVAATPLDPSMRSVTATPPPLIKTVAAAHWPPVTISPGWIDAVVLASMRTARTFRAPTFDSAVTVAVTGAAVVFVIDTVAAATDPPPTLNPAHVNCDDSAAGLATSETGGVGAALCVPPPATEAAMAITARLPTSAPTIAGRRRSLRSRRRRVSLTASAPRALRDRPARRVGGATTSRAIGVARSSRAKRRANRRA